MRDLGHQELREPRVSAGPAHHQRNGDAHMTKSSCIVIDVVTGCASGGKPGVAPDTGGDDQADAPPRPDAADTDAPSHPDAMPDAPQQPVTVTLQETVNNTIAAANSIACGNSTGTS